MNLYIDVSALQFGNWSGVQFYIYRLLSAMTELGSEHRFHLHFGRMGEDPRIEELVNRPNVIRHSHPGKYRSYLSIPLEVLRTHSKVYFMMSGDGKLRIPMPSQTAAVVYDCGRHVLPERYGVSDPIGERQMVAKHLKARGLVVTISETVKSEIVSLFGLDAGKVVVAPCAVERPIEGDEGVRPESLPQNRPYFLMVNSGRAYKNWEDTIAAFGIYVGSNERDLETLLVLAGDLRTETEVVQRAIAATGCSDRIVCLGYVSDDEITYLYRNARISLFPSRYEGFGIPALEAMAHNLPLIISDIPVMTEVCGDAAFAVRLDKPGLLAEAMAAVNTDEVLRQNLIAKGKERIEAYSWPASARVALDALVKLGSR